MKDYRETVPKRDRTGNRTGYTTGTNAAAAAKACTIALLTGAWPERVTVSLPIGETAVMRPVETVLTADYAYCCMVKDAGDDPDVTHGALICAKVWRSKGAGIVLEGGVGVGRVTLPGIGLPVGDPAINIVPRQQIRENVAEGMREAGAAPAHIGLTVEISVPEGEALAKNTLNAKLGIVGGISILGTTGKVYPYSTASWRASVIQAVEVAATNSKEVVVLTTGGRSERYAKSFWADLPEVAFVQLSVFTGAGLETAANHGVKRAIFVGMMGKMIKTAQGHFTTHVAGNQVDFDFLADVCREAGAPDALVAQVAEANTGRHFLELCQAHNFMAPVHRVTALALAQCETFVRGLGSPMQLETVLVEFNKADIISHAVGEAGEAKGAIASAETLMERLARDPKRSYEGDEDGRFLDDA